MSMLLKGTNGNEFELALVRDSLAEPQDGHGDAEWTTVNFRAATAADSWEESAPCMNVYGLTNLAEWLAAVGGDTPGEVGEIEILEPELKFSVSQQGAAEVTIRVGFHLDHRPDEFGVDAPTDEEFVDVHLSRQNVLAAAESLRHDLDRVVSPAGDKDDLGGADAASLGAPDDDLNIVDAIEPEPPGAGFGEDSAGER